MNNVELVDTHCHLTMDVFEEDLDQVIRKARSVGVKRILVPGTDIVSSRRAIQLAENYTEVYAAVGVHPHNASTWGDATARQLGDLAQRSKVVALGEIGLDYYRNLSPPDIQVTCFKDQLELAKALDLPIIVHNRESIEQVMEILQRWREDLSGERRGAPGVLHAYSADHKFAKKAIENDFYLGIAGPITFKNAEELRTLVYNLPIERMLVETDSPYLSPEPERGKRNEPSNVQWIVEKMASVREQDPEWIARKTTINAETLFSWTDGNTDGNLL